MKKPRTAQEQAIATSRVAAAHRLERHRPKTHASKKAYNRTQAKRHWQKNQDGASFFVSGIISGPTADHQMTQMEDKYMSQSVNR